EREVVAAARLNEGGGAAGDLVRAVTARDLVLDHDVGELDLEVRRERRDRRQAREVAVRVGDLVVREVGEGLEAGPADGWNGDERQKAVLARQVELRVHPLHLDDAGDVRVQTGVSRVSGMLARIDGDSTGDARGARGARGYRTVP